LDDLGNLASGDLDGDVVDIHVVGRIEGDGESVEVGVDSWVKVSTRRVGRYDSLTEGYGAVSNVIPLVLDVGWAINAAAVAIQLHVGVAVELVIRINHKRESVDRERVVDAIRAFKAVGVKLVDIQPGDKVVSAKGDGRIAEHIDAVKHPTVADDKGPIADVVYGSRFLGGPRRPAMFWHMVANKLLTFITNILYDTILTDMETGYKVFRREVVENMPLHAKRFEFEPEFTAKILKRKVRIFEVPISFNPRDYNEGKKIGIIDAFEAIWALLKYRFVD